MSSKFSRTTTHVTVVPRKIRASWWAMALRQEDAGEWKYEVRSTKYEVKELGATELRGGVGRKQSWNDAWGINQSTREIEALWYEERLKAAWELVWRRFAEIFSGQE